MGEQSVGIMHYLELCVVNSDFDILSVVETYLWKRKVINVDGYKWFGNNRKDIHVNARKGSGGVGFLIKNDLLRYYRVKVLDDTEEGILWVKLVNSFK
jgi:hypothetical protein